MSTIPSPTIAALLEEYERSLDHTASLWTDLSVDEVHWRPSEESSAIGWHLGHQAAVAHFMVRNLTAAEPSPDPELDGLMDGATAEPDRGVLPGLDRLGAYRDAVADRLRFRIGNIDDGDTVIERGARQQHVLRHAHQFTAQAFGGRHHDHGPRQPPDRQGGQAHGGYDR